MAGKPLPIPGTAGVRGTWSFQLEGHKIAPDPPWAGQSKTDEFGAPRSDPKPSFGLAKGVGGN